MAPRLVACGSPPATALSVEAATGSAEQTDAPSSTGEMARPATGLPGTTTIPTPSSSSPTSKSAAATGLTVELLGALDKSARAPHRDALRDAANRDESSAVRGAAFTVLEADEQFVLAGEDEGKTGPQFTMGASSPRRSLSPNASLGRSRAQRSIARSKQRHKSPELRKSAAEWAQKMTPSPPPSRDGEAAAATARHQSNRTSCNSKLGPSSLVR